MLHSWSARLTFPLNIIRHNPLPRTYHLAHLNMWVFILSKYPKYIFDVLSHLFVSKVPLNYKGVPKLTQDLNLIENTVFSLDYVIFLLNYKVHRIGLFVE